MKRSFWKQIISGVLVCLTVFVGGIPCFAAGEGVPTGYDRGYAEGYAGEGRVVAKGLDLSEHQGSGFDFQKVKDAGYTYVILRCGFYKRKDYCFEEYYKAARKVGLDIGTYFYSYATNATAAKKEAELCLEYIKGKKFEYPVYFDFEDPSANSKRAVVAKKICLAFMDRVAQEGYLVGMYSMASWIDDVDYGGWVPLKEICGDKYEVWIANYYPAKLEEFTEKYSSRYGMYQYTSSNYIDEVGPLDTNRCFKDYPSIVKKYGFNGYSPKVDVTCEIAYAKLGGTTLTVSGKAYDKENPSGELELSVIVNSITVGTLTTVNQCFEGTFELPKRLDAAELEIVPKVSTVDVEKGFAVDLINEAPIEVDKPGVDDDNDRAQDKEDKENKKGKEDKKIDLPLVISASVLGVAVVALVVVLLSGKGKKKNESVSQIEETEIKK